MKTKKEYIVEVSFDSNTENKVIKKARKRCRKNGGEITSLTYRFESKKDAQKAMTDLGDLMEKGASSSFGERK